MGKKFLTILVFALFGTTLSAKTTKQQKETADASTLMASHAKFVIMYKVEKDAFIISGIKGF